jgi:hypothetical protein
MRSISRRDLISAWLSAGAAAILPGELLPRQSPGAQAAELSTTSLLRVSRVSDPSSVPTVNRLFPGLLGDDGFQPLRLAAFLVTNAGKQNIRAFSSHWIITTSRGRSELTIMHYFHPRAGRIGRKNVHWGIKGNRTRFTGSVPIIRAGSTRLVTPFFNWSPSYYRNHGSPDWPKLLSRRARPEVMLLDVAGPGASVTMTIVGVIIHSSAAGPDAKNLARVFSVTRNAEHDEAVSVLRRVSAGASAGQVRDQLRCDGGGLAFDIQPNSDLYYRVRQRQAKVLLRRFQKARSDQFRRTLEYLASKPKTNIHTISAA